MNLKQMYEILSVIGWSWCAIVFVFLAIKLSRSSPVTSSDEASRDSE